MFTFSTTGYEVLWKTLELPAMPVRITVDQHGATLDEREHLGYGRPPDLDPHLTDLLRVLAHHERAVDFRELTPNGRTGATAHPGGGRARRRGYLAR